jgi:hypothetical protein
LHSNLPLVLAGRGGGTLHWAQYLQVPDPTPMCDLHLALAQRLGVKLDRFGDSTGCLQGISESSVLPSEHAATIKHLEGHLPAASISVGAQNTSSPNRTRLCHLAI